ncbi:MAG: carbamoyltransferase HypF, partial [Verrucomicrobiae bacterium]|nr:carbamoyltransferase HypF [Verrucomicrobiae bacterium]
GAVQGVGFRPFVFRLATELNLAGWARNALAGLVVEIEGPPEDCAAFLERVEKNPPPFATVRHIAHSPRPVEGGSGFRIHHSRLESAAGTEAANTEILPDLATCPDCLREIFDPANRRHLYPFTNCTQCGPRFSIVLALPYDRERTTMRGFPLCAACRDEYESPGDRRFHAQPNACPDCGPRLEFTDPSGHRLATRGEALERAAQAIESGQIVAVKGVGGFHLIADARSAEVVETLRARKHRPAKPLALMMPHLAAARAHCEISPAEEDLLTSARAPIVLLRRLSGGELPAVLAPGNPTFGVMLPYSPLHHLLLRRLGFPVVATSGNVSDEPICIDNDKALDRLRGIADAFLLHDRPIARPVDDSVVRVAAGRELLLRHSRGYAPLSLGGESAPVLAVGGDQKTALAVSGPFGVRCGPHLGDLETEAARLAFEAQCRDFPALCGAPPRAIACDAHPGYRGARWAAEAGPP